MLKWTWKVIWRLSCDHSERGSERSAERRSGLTINKEFWHDDNGGNYLDILLYCTEMNLLVQKAVYPSILTTLAELTGAPLSSNIWAMSRNPPWAAKNRAVVPVWGSETNNCRHRSQTPDICIQKYGVIFTQFVILPEVLLLDSSTSSMEQNSSEKLTVT